jgi:hypothetical protein
MAGSTLEWRGELAQRARYGATRQDLEFSRLHGGERPEDKR